MDRRGFLLLLAAGAASALGGCQVGSEAGGPGAPSGAPTPAPPSTPNSPAPATTAAAATTAAPTSAAPSTAPPTPRVVRSIAPAVPAAPTVISALPGQGSSIALTVDDGVDTEVVRAYLDFIRSSRVKVTFFVNGQRPSWTDHRDAIIELIEAGLVQIGNHTWSHPDLSVSSAATIRDEITRNETFIQDSYGVSGRPFLRPPFGKYTGESNRIAGDLGYSMITMWYGSLSDSTLISEDVLLAQAQKWLTAQRIVIGHANFPTVTHVYGQILDLLRERSLQTVLLSEAFPA